MRQTEENILFKVSELSVLNKDGQSINLTKPIICIYLDSENAKKINIVVSVATKLPDFQFLLAGDWQPHKLFFPHNQQIPDNLFTTRESEQTRELLKSVDLLVFLETYPENLDRTLDTVKSEIPTLYFDSRNEREQQLSDHHSYVISEELNLNLLWLFIKRFFDQSNDNILKSKDLSLVPSATIIADLTTTYRDETMIEKQLKVDYFSQGAKLQEQGDLDAAIHNYYQALRADTQQPLWVFCNLIKCLETSGKFPEALQIIEESIKLYPQSSEIYRLRGVIYDHLDNKTEVISNYQAAITIEPDQPSWVYYVLANYYLAENQKKQSEQIAKQGIKTYSEDPDLHRLLGIIHDLDNNIGEVLYHYQIAVDYNSKQPFWVYSVLIQYLHYQDQLEKAIEIGNKSIQIYPEENELYYHLSLAQAKNNEISKAINNLQESIRLNPKHFFSYLSLGKIYLKQNRWQQASTVLYQAIEVNSNSYEAYLCLGESLAWQGEIDSASMCFYQSIKLGLFD
ncbi:MAG: tetratricopeptide repeat protein [Patescibacteria group bacterium]